MASEKDTPVPEVYRNVIEVFTLPKGYAVPSDEWDRALRKAVFIMGCDWLDYLNNRFNPMPGMRVIELCDELARLRLNAKELDAARAAGRAEGLKLASNECRERIKRIAESGVEGTVEALFARGALDSLAGSIDALAKETPHAK
jgi:hypothetical protein